MAWALTLTAVAFISWLAIVGRSEGVEIVLILCHGAALIVFASAAVDTSNPVIVGLAALAVLDFLLDLVDRFDRFPGSPRGEHPSTRPESRR